MSSCKCLLQKMISNSLIWKWHHESQTAASWNYCFRFEQQAALERKPTQNYQQKAKKTKQPPSKKNGISNSSYYFSQTRPGEQSRLVRVEIAQNVFVFRFARKRFFPIYHSWGGLARPLLFLGSALDPPLITNCIVIRGFL